LNREIITEKGTGEREGKGVIKGYAYVKRHNEAHYSVELTGTNFLREEITLDTILFKMIPGTQ
jgi:hypothetical protein